MLWFVAALCGSLIVGRYAEKNWRTGKREWDAEFFAMGLFGFGLVALLANAIVMGVSDGRMELAATHKIDTIRDDQYLAVNSGSSGGTLRYRVHNEIDSRSAGKYDIVKSNDPHVEIYNNRPSSVWFAVFGGDQLTKIYVPNTNITLKD